MKKDLKSVLSIFGMLFLLAYFIYGNVILGSIGLVGAGLIEVHNVYTIFKNDNYINFMKVLFAMFFIGLGFYLPFM